MPKLLREVKKERLVELYLNQLKSINQIAKIERISSAGVLTLMRRYSIKSRSISEAKKLRKAK